MGNWQGWYSSALVSVNRQTPVFCLLTALLLVSLEMTSPSTPAFCSLSSSMDLLCRLIYKTWKISCPVSWVINTLLSEALLIWNDFCKYCLLQWKAGNSCTSSTTYFLYLACWLLHSVLPDCWLATFYDGNIKTFLHYTLRIPLLFHWHISFPTFSVDPFHNAPDLLPFAIINGNITFGHVPSAARVLSWSNPLLSP